MATVRQAVADHYYSPLVLYKIHIYVRTRQSQYRGSSFLEYVYFNVQRSKQRGNLSRHIQS